MKKWALGLVVMGLSTQAWSYGIGVSTFPMMTDTKMVSAEFTGITSTGGGVGMQARYSQKMNSALMLDAGVGLGAGERSNRLFAGADYEILPDYMNQPRVSVKTTLSNAREFEKRRNILSLAPTLSKGFSFWGEEAYPFVALPMGLSLESGSKTYETVMALSLGMTGQLPVDGYRHLTGNVEATVDIKDAYTGIFFGVSYPIN